MLKLILKLLQFGQVVIDVDYRDLWKDKKRLGALASLSVLILTFLLPEVDNILSVWNSPERVLQRELGSVFEEVADSIGASDVALLAYHNGDLLTDPKDRAYTRRTAVIKVPKDNKNRYKDLIVIPRSELYTNHEKGLCTFYPDIETNPRAAFFALIDGDIIATTSCPIISRFDQHLVGYTAFAFKRKVSPDEEQAIYDAHLRLQSLLTQSETFVILFETEARFKPRKWLMAL